ncbi:MAG: 3-oxo-4,17-pregnadiene-20-carboxyl-CoA hydratase beta subunit [Pseudonocardiales bacterium]|nr:3-oxo-4,17-pregnadiene-20-carboxyl-CoA hydratase beta subunit [Pseudonocardiales bacterium]
MSDRTRAAESHPTAVDPSSITVGMTLPTVRIPVSTTLIVTGAIASRDFFAGHHDAAAARAGGQPDVFMNIMTTSGLLGAYLTDWAGPHASLRSLDLVLGVANLPGDTMTIEGEVTGVESQNGAVVVTLALHGDNERGRHASAEAVVAVPSAGAP